MQLRYNVSSHAALYRTPGMSLSTYPHCPQREKKSSKKREKDYDYFRVPFFMRQYGYYELFVKPIGIASSHSLRSLLAMTAPIYLFLLTAFLF